MRRDYTNCREKRHRARNAASQHRDFHVFLRFGTIRVMRRRQKSGAFNPCTLKERSAMWKFSIFLLAAAIMSFAAAMAGPAFAGNHGACVEDGYGLGWKGGRPYYYTPFGVKGSFDCFTRSNVTRTTGKRATDRLYSDR